MPQAKLPDVIFKDATIKFRNFAGEKRKFNAEGERNFNLVLEDHEFAKELLSKGWNIKFRESRYEEGEVEALVEVKINYGYRPPMIYLVNTRHKRLLGEEEIDQLDLLSYSKLDLVIAQHPWDVNGKQGIKAYLRSLYFTVDETELDQDYDSVPDWTGVQYVDEDPS